MKFFVQCHRCTPGLDTLHGDCVEECYLCEGMGFVECEEGYGVKIAEADLLRKVIDAFQWAFKDSGRDLEKTEDIFRQNPEISYAQYIEEINK